MAKLIPLILLIVVVFMGCKEDPVGPNKPPTIGDSRCSIVQYTNGYFPTGLIYCKVSDPDGLDDIENAQWISKQTGGNDVFVSLYDDGTHGDITSDDGVYTTDWDQYSVAIWTVSSPKEIH